MYNNNFNADDKNIVEIYQNETDYSMNGFIEIGAQTFIKGIWNLFKGNYRNPSVPFLYFNTDLDTNCLDFNTFYGKAIFIQDGDI